MNTYFLLAACLTFILGVIHSVLGEILIFRHLRKAAPVPSGDRSVLKERHIRSLWSSWHLVTLFGWSLATILLWLSWPASADGSLAFIKDAMTLTFLLAAVFWLYGTRGRHPAWIAFLVIAALAWLA